jgi:hypothetical protein
MNLFPKQMIQMMHMRVFSSTRLVHLPQTPRFDHEVQIIRSSGDMLQDTCYLHYFTDYSTFILGARIANR